jgi:hypothetical protein
MPQAPTKKWHNWKYKERQRRNKNATRPHLIDARSLLGHRRNISGGVISQPPEDFRTHSTPIGRHEASQARPTERSFGDDKRVTRSPLWIKHLQYAGGTTRKQIQRTQNKQTRPRTQSEQTTKLNALQKQHVKKRTTEHNQCKQQQEQKKSTAP